MYSPVPIGNSTAALEFTQQHYCAPDWADGAITRKDAAFLFDLIALERPQRVVEIGVASGVSTAYLSRVLAHLCPSATLQAFDIAENFYADRTKRVGQFLWDCFGGLPANVRLTTGVSSLEAIARVEADQDIDLLFIDGNHHAPWATLDVLSLIPILSKSAWISLHDIDLPNLMEAHQEFGPKKLFDSWPGLRRISSDERPNIGAVKLSNSTTRNLDDLLATIEEQDWRRHVPAEAKRQFRIRLETLVPENDPCLLSFTLDPELSEHSKQLPSTAPRSDEQGTEGILASLQKEIADLLQLYLEQKAVSQSSVAGNTVTGNAYQTVMLGDVVINGFRETRSELLAGLDIRGKAVADLGSNLGEVSRDLSRGGAILVDAYEYDAFFTQLARYITAYNCLYNVQHIQADISKEGFIHQKYDISLSLSTFAYVSPNIDYILSNTNEAFILETHEIQSNWVEYYVSRTIRYFPHWCCFGIVAHGNAAFSKGKRRLWLHFSKQDQMAFYRNRAFSLQDNSNSVMKINLEDSSFPFLRVISNSLAAHGLSWKADVNMRMLEVRLGELENLYQGGTCDVSMSGEAYWLSFLISILGYVDGLKTNIDCVYGKWLKRKLHTLKDDPWLMPILEDDKLFAEFAYNRIGYFASMFRGNSQGCQPLLIAFNPTRYDGTLGENVTLLCTEAGDKLYVPTIDGHHRVFVSKIRGDLFGSFMPIWDFSYLRFTPDLIESGYEKRIIDHLTEA